MLYSSISIALIACLSAFVPAVSATTKTAKLRAIIYGGPSVPYYVSYSSLESLYLLTTNVQDATTFTIPNDHCVQLPQSFSLAAGSSFASVIVPTASSFNLSNLGDVARIGSTANPPDSKSKAETNVFHLYCRGPSQLSVNFVAADGTKQVLYFATNMKSTAQLPLYAVLPSNNYKNKDGQQIQNPVDLIFDDTDAMFPCNANVATCSADRPDNALTCISPYLLFHNQAGYKVDSCLASCPSDQVYYTAAGVCKPCNFNGCASCDSKGPTSCMANRYLSTTDGCVTRCRDGFYGVTVAGKPTKSYCTACKDSRAATCNASGSLTCNGRYTPVNGVCTASKAPTCPDGKYSYHGGDCRTCPDNTATCEASSAGDAYALTCKTGYEIYRRSGYSYCVKICPAGQVHSPRGCIAHH